MPDDKDRNELSEEDRAALDYERRREEEAETRGRTEQLTKLFYKTPAMAEHAEMINAVQNSRNWTPQTVCIEVSKPLLTMLEFQERAEAAEQGRAPTPIDKVLARIVDNELQDQLHWLAVEPAHFERYRNLYMWVCWRCWTVQNREAVPLFGPGGLVHQLGVGGYTERRKFRQTIKRWLSVTRSLWPSCPATLSADGISLLVSHAEGIRSSQNKSGKKSNQMLSPA